VRPAPVGPAPAHAPVLPDPETARAWLRIERDNIEHAAVYSRTHDLHEHTIALTAGLAEILRTDGPYVHALALHQTATEIAQHHGHADALTDLGIMRRLNGDLAGAQEALTRALEIHRATGNAKVKPKRSSNWDARAAWQAISPGPATPPHRPSRSTVRPASATARPTRWPTWGSCGARPGIRPGRRSPSARHWRSTLRPATVTVRRTR
jgi:hypothetical protein